MRENEVQTDKHAVYVELETQKQIGKWAKNIKRSAGKQSQGQRNCILRASQNCDFLFSFTSACRRQI